MLPICETVDEAIAIIRTAKQSNLRSAYWLENELLPSLGLHESLRAKRELHRYIGKGIRSWQSPAQFSRYLAHISQLGITKYLEIGINHGGTFIITVEYLSRFADDFIAAGVDLKLQPIVLEYAAKNSHVTLHETDTRTREAGLIIAQQDWDLVMIDGDHSEEGCANDYALVKDHSAYIAFHDIVHDLSPGVGAVWQRIGQVTPGRLLLEFVEQYPGVVIHQKGLRDYGIGLVNFRGE